MRAPLSDIHTQTLPCLLATTLFACVVSSYITWQMHNEVPSTFIDRKLVFPPRSCVNRLTRHKITGTFQTRLRACRLSSDTNKRRDLAECMYAFPSAFHDFSVGTSILSYQRPCEQASARPKLDSPVILAPSFGKFGNYSVYWRSRIIVNYVPKNEQNKLKFNTRNDLFCTSYFHYFTSVKWCHATSLQ